MKKLYSSVFQTPLGLMIAMAEDNGLVLLEFYDRPALPTEEHELQKRYGYTILPGRTPHHDAIEREIAEYFACTLQEFTVPLITPGTSFQLRVWNALRQVPYGTTASYGELAIAAGTTMGASRAVGAANGQNRLAVVIPCHRVIGADGSLTGYGGGKHRKEALLRLERATRFDGPPAEQASLFEELKVKS
ncbi:MAG: methylated-DNA--[protein]-cysteine S-methyltransferase [Acidobacteriaceae bacterium]|nr:methylated-DNA--[protein]-cysteine S-methyltransferase [Acidobacteriaceae bacterium]